MLCDGSSVSSKSVNVVSFTTVTAHQLTQLFFYLVIASDYCLASTSLTNNETIDYEEECTDVALGVCKGAIYGYVQGFGCDITTSQLVALQNECEGTITKLTPSPVAVGETNNPLITPTPTPALELVTSSPSAQPMKSASVQPTKAPSLNPTARPSKTPVTDAPTTMQPSALPSQSPSTASPSREPTSFPSASPTLSPVTDAPTESPSFSPTDHPTTIVRVNIIAELFLVPVVAHTMHIIPQAPTRSPVEGPQPSSSPSISLLPSATPSMEPSTTSPSSSPTTAEPSPQPSDQPSLSPTLKPTIPLQSFSVPTSMIFYTSDRFKGSVLETWKLVTSERTKKYILIEIDKEDESVTDCTVELEIVSQNNLPNGQSGNLRRLQESETPLLINYTTITQFYSLKGDWDPNKFVSSGFTTNSQQRSYMYQLKAADETNFDTVNKFQMIVDGAVITETPVTPHEPGDGDNNSTLIWAIIGAAFGTLATASLIGAAIYVKKRSKRLNSDKSAEAAFPDVEVLTNDDKPQSSSYFGTIESREGEQDDVSTLGDPYFGEAVNAVMDRDDTVAESMISAEQDMYVYGVGRPRLDTGTTSSRMDTTISGKSGTKMMFNDDTTLEDIYKTPVMNIYNQEDGNSERITVVAPSGKLGIVIDNPAGDIPLVHAIKETSALNGRIKVGDFLLSVDERDCRGMSAVAVSKLISSRSENPSRTFVILRGSTTGEEE